MGFLKDRVCVLFPAEFTVEIDTQILVNCNSLYRFPSDDNGRRLVIISAKVHNHLSCLPYMQLQVVPLTPLHKTVTFLSVVFVVVVVVVCNQSSQNGFVSILVYYADGLKDLQSAVYMIYMGRLPCMTREL